jgi:hypothetical protein
MDTPLLVVLGTIVAVGLLYLYVPYARRRRWQAASQEPATKGDSRRLAGEVSDVSSSVSGIRDELDKLRTAVSETSEISEDVADIQEELGRIGATLSALDGIRTDLYAVRRLLRAIAHQQWTPEWNPE